MLKKISVPRDTKLAIVGDIHEHESQFDEIIERVKPSEKTYLVSVGDIYDKGFGVSVAESITWKIRDMVDAGVGFVIRGNHELKVIRRAKQQGCMTEQLEWFDSQPLALSFEFYNRTRVTVVHGGVLPSHTWDDLNNEVDTCYVRTVDENGKLVKLVHKVKNGKKVMEPARPGVTWHKKYDGRFGYIVSGHDSQKDGIPKFYRYSCNLDTAVYNTGKLTCQIINERGREKIIYAEGRAKYPDLDDMYRKMAEGLV